MPQTNNQAVVIQIEIKVDGADLSNTIMDRLAEVEVETSLYLPSMVVLRFHDEDLELIDGEQLKAGKTVEIKLPDSLGALTTIFKGEITAVEPHFSADYIASLEVRGYDKGHRLHRGTKTKVFVQMTDSDIVSQIASNAGLTANVEATTQVYNHVFQYSVSDWAFIHERARRNGYEVQVDDSTLYFRKASTTSGTATVKWGETLVSFQPRLTLAKQVEKVVVKGWDPKQKQAIVGQATSSSSAPAVGIGNWGGPLAQAAFSSAQVLEVRHPVNSQSEADAMAQAMLNEINAGFLQADGTASGNPVIKAGAKVTIQNVGTKFSGAYVVTTARHVYSTEEGYLTHFTVQGARAQTMADLIDQSMVEQRASQFWGGIVIGIVTNNSDSENNMARVKVKFPWLDDQLESNWARVSAPGAGSSRGMLWMPEVNDEVLVAFEHGDFDYPYIVGAVWNGTDATPETTSVAVNNGKVEVREFKTRLGHTIKLTDSDSAKTIEINGSDGNTNIKFDETNKKITINSKGDVDIISTGNMNLKATGNLSLEATGNVTVKGNQTSVEATGPFTVKGATGTVQASGPMAVKGAVVNIN